MTYSETSIPYEESSPRQNRLKDYFCPFCNHKLFRGDVKEFKLVCQECNKLVDSSAINTEPDSES